MRDLVQFVPFNKYKNNPEKLAAYAAQLKEYFK